MQSYKSILLNDLMLCYSYTTPALRNLSGESDAADHEDGTHDESEDDVPMTGLSSFLRGFGSHAASSDVNLSSSNASSTPKAKAKALAKSSVRASKGKQAVAIKTDVVGNAASGSKRKKVDNTTPSTESTTSDAHSSKRPRGGETDDISEADRITLETFDQKIDSIKSLQPPVSVSAFKSYMSDHLTKVSGLVQELRLKKKSADRRSGSKTNRPDMLFLEGLSALDSKVKEIAKLVRCDSNIIYLWITFSFLFDNSMHYYLKHFILQTNYLNSFSPSLQFTDFILTTTYFCNFDSLEFRVRV